MLSVASNYQVTGGLASWKHGSMTRHYTCLSNYHCHCCMCTWSAFSCSAYNQCRDIIAFSVSFHKRIIKCHFAMTRVSSYLTTCFKVQIIEAHPNWPMNADIFEHPPPWLASRFTIWSDMQLVDTTMQWREDWSSASVVKHSIVTNPTI